MQMKFAASDKLLSFRTVLRHCRRRSSEASSQRRVSPLNIQMLSKRLHEQIFGEEHVVSPEAVKRSQAHLEAHGLWGKGGNLQPDVDMSIPPLQGNNIDEHFRSIAAAQCEPYLSIARHVASWQLPVMPKKWRAVAGWTRYDGTNAVSVDYPEENGLVFDVEVLVTEGHLPVMAVAVSDKHWYSWTSGRLESTEEYCGHEEKPTDARNLVPMGSVGHHRLIVGHNVGYDRARIREQYVIEDTLTRFMDTLSLHVCVAGQTTAQKGLWTHKDGASKVRGEEQDWMSVSCPNGLADVHWLYVGAQKGQERLNKDMRNMFVKGKIHDVRKNFQALMKYCALDVLHTHEVFQEVLPAFLKRCPHPVTLAGMLEMGTAYLPIASNWDQYLADSEYVYEDMEREIKSKLMALADDACVYMHNERYKDDIWLCNLDWEPKKFRGKALSKAAMKKLLHDIEDCTRRQREAFSRAGTEEEDGEEFKYLIAAKEPTSFKRRVHMPGYPGYEGRGYDQVTLWYRDLCMRRSEEAWVPGCVHISAQTRVTPYLLRMTWKGRPLHHHQRMGWGYLVSREPPEGKRGSDSEEERERARVTTSDSSVVEDVMEMLRDMELGEETLLDTRRFLREMTLKAEEAVPLRESDGTDNQSDETQGTLQEEWAPIRISSVFGTTDDVITLRGKEYCFYKIPHKDGPAANCGNPLSKDYLHKMEDGTLSSAAGGDGQRILTLNSMVSFWRSARSRIMDQFVVSTGGGARREECHQIIIPQVIVAGTATRRAVEPTWLTASNAKENRVGSELKAMVRAPPGYHLVGADVDSQELWIASVMGDEHFAGMHGSTAIGWMTLRGSKSDGTDVHSKTAKAVGISRDHAKVLNYGRFYGAGRPFTELLMKQFNPSLSSAEVVDRTNALFMATKGTRGFQLTKEGALKAKSLDIPFGDSGTISAADLKLLRSSLQTLGRPTGSLATKVWVGGSESDLFNKLETIAAANQPKTPVLGCCISKALEKRYVGNEFITSKVNWVVQSSAVDYLHLMLVCMRWLFDTYKIDGRFCISIHDEVRYLVRSEDRYRAALALQITNLLTRSMFAYRLGMKDLPLSVAFFSAVDLDTVLRKEVTMDCRTPSNPLGLKEGQGIPPGEALDIYAIIQRTNGRLG